MREQADAMDAMFKSVRKTVKVYRLYIWTKKGMPAGQKVRGRCIGSFSRYKDLVADAERRAVAAGYPKSRWMDLFDWNV